jgi:hypothetical protein
VPESGGATDRSLDVLVAAAGVLYPSPVTDRRGFVETYALGRIEGREDYRAGVGTTTAELNDAARAWYGDGFPDLATDRRGDVLRELGADTADPEPEGSVAGRVRYYVVEELLYALYASPAGGRLAGLENPPGYPGGTASYRRGPEP